LYLKIHYDIQDYDKLYNMKLHIYNNLTHTEKINYIDGVLEFINFIIHNNKKFIIVSNTSIKNINNFKKNYYFLNEAHKIYTKENFFYKKPNPECYLKIINEYPNQKCICFEDSLPPIHALYQVTQITPVYIHNHNYYYHDHILEKYPNVLISRNYDINDLNNQILIKNDETKNYIDSILNHNINQLKNNFQNMSHIIYSISILLKNIDPNNYIYLSGMGKSGYICKKSASTWQSLAIKASYIDLPNLPHGDFGIFRDGDILLLISNGGNTTEIIYILKYIKETLKTKINVISIIANKNTEMEKYSNMTYILENIIEADNINMTPSTSSLIFMSLLDAISINIRHDITKDEFKNYHPSGSLGKR